MLLVLNSSISRIATLKHLSLAQQKILDANEPCEFLKVTPTFDCKV